VPPGGVKVAEVVWCSAPYLDRHRQALCSGEAAMVQAPDLCVEIMSPSNSRAEMEERAGLYLAAGAREVWILGTDLSATIFGTEGSRAESALGVSAAALVSSAKARLL
jgi:hypothetical protein